MEIHGERVILRDFIEADIEKRLYWETTETEWQQWDTPWIYEGRDPETLRKELEAYREKLAILASLDPNRKNLRTSFQITLKDTAKTYIGWCSAYNIDSQYRLCPGGHRWAVGIALPPPEARGKGYAKEALQLYLQYLISSGIEEIYMQTWSGNGPILGLAHRLGFRECHRQANAHQVRGGLYDALTLRLDPLLFQKIPMVPLGF